jgi:ribosomal protein S18 acetylase RimI-like enzyme
MISATDLDNPIWNALGSHHQHLGFSVGSARKYKNSVSPFAGLERYDQRGFADLRMIVAPYETVALFSSSRIEVPKSWRTVMDREIVQMVLDSPCVVPADAPPMRSLSVADLPEVLSLTARTAPGPFLRGTMDMGHYLGIHHFGELVAMAGERFSLPSFTEVSAVCTASAHRGKGYAGSLVSTVAATIQSNGRIPFLHVKGENRAQGLYESLGFKVRRLIHLAVVSPLR